MNPPSRPFDEYGVAHPVKAKTAQKIRNFFILYLLQFVINKCYPLVITLVNKRNLGVIKGRLTPLKLVREATRVNTKRRTFLPQF